jgi:hypothetical protein
MPYHRHGYELRYLRDFKRAPSKTWKQLEREQSKRDKVNARRMARAVEAAREEEALDRARALARAERAARAQARSDQPESSPEPQWVNVRALTPPAPAGTHIQT